MNNFSALSQGVKVYSISDDYSGVSLTNPTIPEEFLSVKKEAVNIGKHVIIGSGSVILPGVSIDEGSSVGALSLVNKSLEAWGVYIGVPAKRINFRKKILLEQEDKLIKKIGKILPEFD